MASSATNLRNDITDLNLSYLMLAQQMVRDDLEAAMYKLGASKDLAQVLERLSPAQILKMASSEVLLCRLRFDDRLLADLLSGYGKERLMAKSHATILMAGQPAAGVA